MLSPAFYIGRRYAAIRSSNSLVSFISMMSVLGLALGVSILITVLSVMNGFDRELQQRILALVPHITVTTPRSVPLMNEQEWEDYRNIMQQSSGVLASAPYLQLQGMLLANGKTKGVVLNGIDPVQEQQVSIISQFVEAGSLDYMPASSYGIAIGRGLAQQLELSLGDSVMLVSTEVPITLLGEFARQRSFTVSAIFNVGSQIDNNLALVNLRDAQRLYRLGDNIHGYRLQTEDLFDVYRINTELQEAINDSLVFADWTSTYGNIYQNIRMSKTLVGLLLTLLVAVAAFNIIVSLMMVVRDKQGDIAILRTMGASFATIKRIFLVQGLMISLIGTAVGLALGIIFSLSVSAFFAWLQGVLGVQLLSSDIYPVNYLPSQLRASDLFLVCLLSLALSLLATIYPSSSAARTKPAQILRHE